MTTASKIVQITADSVVIDGEVVTTIVALLDDGTVAYTGAAFDAEWHRLPPIPDSED